MDADKDTDKDTDKDKDTDMDALMDNDFKKIARLAIVAPCFNEEMVLPDSALKLMALLDSMKSEGLVAGDSFLLFVNDGSADRTWDIISELHADNPACHGLNLAANVGHQNAILAGMMTAVGPEENTDVVITIDVDLQDPLECIPMMMKEYYNGSDVVYGVRSSRKSDTFLKRFTAEAFYKLQKKMGVNAIFNHADFRLMSSRVVRELERYEERNLFLRGIIPMIGYPSATVEEVRAPREKGKTKYSFRKMATLALDGITSFSVTPIYMILGIGVIFVVIALAIAVYVLISLLTGHVVHGWSSLILSIWLVGGMIIVAVGLVGLYVGKVFIETKHRPRYHILDHLN